MKLLRVRDEKYEFEFAPRERNLMLGVLNLYPLVPAAHYRLTRMGRLRKQKDNQALLDEAIAAQRQANKKQILALLNEPGRFAETGDACRAQFTRAELEWLLQVLNDVRVGSWIALGSPGYEAKEVPLDDGLAHPHLLKMEIAGMFEMFFLDAVSGRLRLGADE
jgi:hypothetical protein